jgi:hypothetical protein
MIGWRWIHARLPSMRAVTACRANHVRFGCRHGDGRFTNSNFEPRHKNNFTCYLNQLTIPTAVSPNFSVSFFQKL